MKKIVTILLMLVALTGRAQAPKGQVELFCGAEMEYADVNFHRLYDILLNLTPGVKWHLGNDWQVAGQLWVPIINDGYLDRYSMWRLNMAVVSKELHWQSARQHVKLSAGLFNKERGGFDVKWHYPVTDWLMLTAQAGVTMRWALGFKWSGQSGGQSGGQASGLDAPDACPPDCPSSESDFGEDWRVSGIAGVNFWLNPWQTEIRLSGGRYVDGIWGSELDVMRHFRYVTIGAFAQLHEASPNSFYKHKISGMFSVYDRKQTAGFKIVVMLPPYKKSDRKFVLRPASNLSLGYNGQQDEVTMQMYHTDPEENAREYPVSVPWGINSAQNQ